MKNYVKVLGVLHILFAGVPGVIGLAILFFSRAVGSVAAVSRGIGGVNSGELRAAAGHDEAMLAIAASCLLLFSLACFLAGLGLIGLRPWARNLGIGVSILDIPLAPVGTILGIYSLCVLVPKVTQRLFTPAVGSDA